MSQKVNLNAYFERIGFAGSIAPTLATLEAIHALHPAAIPHENLDPVMGVPVKLDQASLEHKLLHARRGGYCFEQNMLLRNILRELDFTVRTYPSRVLWELPEGKERIVSHTVLVVDIAGASYFCDVGMSALTLIAPLRLRPGTEQQVGHEAFRFSEIEGGYQLDLKLGEDWHRFLEFQTTEMDDTAVAELSGKIEAIYFERALLFAARGDKAERFNLTGNVLTVHRPDAEREQQVAETVDALKTMLADTFRIALPPAEQLDPALQRVLDKLPKREG
jgi:N-hydroxyarylamine O-acetyltransferase